MGATDSASLSWRPAEWPEDRDKEAIFRDGPEDKWKVGFLTGKTSGWIKNYEQTGYSECFVLAPRSETAEEG